MAHIVRFEVSGLVGRESVYRQALNRDVNVLFGANGSGKTSLLKILHSAMSGNTSILEDVPFEKAQVVIYSINKNREFVRTIEKASNPVAEPTDTDEDSFTVVYHEIERRIVKAKAVRSKMQWHTKPRLPANNAWSHRYLPISRLYQSSQYNSAYDMATFSDDALNRYFASSISSLWTSYTSTLLSAVRTAQEEGLASILRDVLGSVEDEGSADTLSTEIAFTRVKRFLERQGSTDALPSFPRFRDQYSNNPKLRRVVNDINQIEVQIESVMAPRKKLEDLVDSMFTGGKKVDFTDQLIDVRTKKDKSISLASLSSGEKQLMRLLIEGLLAEKNSVIIDEPEISMHIDWQRALVGAIRGLNPHCQLILATHSPEVMAEISDDKIFSL